MSKVLIHSIVFSPDGVSTAYLYNDIALKLKSCGYEVSVLTTTPHYNAIKEEIEKQPLKKKCLGLYSVSNYNGIPVKHVPQKKFKSSFLRILGFVFWHTMSFFLGLFEKDVDIILSPSPPLTIGFINIMLGKLKGAKVIYNVQEIYPDLLIEEKKSTSTLVISLLKKLERFVYNHSDAVTTIDEVFYKTIENRFKDKSKLHIIPNFVDTSIYKPVALDGNKPDKSIFPNTQALKLMYAGNIGYAQDWDPLIKLAIHLREENIEFFIIGEGVMKSFLEEQISKNQLKKVHLVSYQPRELMPYLIAYSDLQFIFMSPQVDGLGFPSKVYTIMACAKPLLVCSGTDTPIVHFLKDKNCAFLIEEKDVDKKNEKMTKILQSIRKEELLAMGNNGLANIHQYYSKEVVTDMYVKLIDSLLEMRK